MAPARQHSPAFGVETRGMAAGGYWSVCGLMRCRISVHVGENLKPGKQKVLLGKVENFSHGELCGT